MSRRGLVCALGGGLLCWWMPAASMTWHFDGEGNAQGWVAREPGSTNGTMDVAPVLRSAVTGGVWRIAMAPFAEGRNPAVELISPVIGQNSELFDRVTVRFRVVHSRPLPYGGVNLRWTNEHNRARPGDEPDTYALYEWCADRGIDEWGCRPRFSVQGETMLYTTDWQQASVTDLRTGWRPHGDGEYYKIWEGELQDIRLSFGGLYEGLGLYYRVQGPAEVPEALEVDWIRLTGTEEQLQGELPPPVAAAQQAFGGLFSVPEVSPLAVSRGVRGYNRNMPGAALGDADGDGDLDVVSSWLTCTQVSAAAPTVDVRRGWVVAYNDGGGSFSRSSMYLWEAAYAWLALDATLGGVADLNGDGMLDQLTYTWGEDVTQVWWNEGEEGTKPGPRWTGYPAAVGDADGDGDTDVWLAAGEGFRLRHELGAEQPRRLLLNDGAGSFDAGILVPSPGMGYYQGEGVYSLGIARPVRAGRLGVLWNPPLDFSQTVGLESPRLGQVAAGYVVSYLGSDGEVVHEPLHTRTHPYNIRYAGDFDGDADTDLVVSEDFGVEMLGDWRIYRGLRFLANRGDGQFDTVATFPEVQLNHGVEMLDVNGDGRLDAVFVHSRLQDPAVMVLLQTAGGRFVLEGRYPLEGGIGAGIAILGGDVDGDGDVDLLVLDRASADGARVLVLRNQLKDGSTVVAEAAERQPTGYRLGPAYPNPFNPEVVIPFVLGEAVPSARVTVYDAVGQGVRVLEVGPLPAGAARVAWDGRDGAGRVLASGVYGYRVEAGSWSATGKVVKSR